MGNEPDQRNPAGQNSASNRAKPAPELTGKPAANAPLDREALLEDLRTLFPPESAPKVPPSNRNGKGAPTQGIVSTKRKKPIGVLGPSLGVLAVIAVVAAAILTRDFSKKPQSPNPDAQGQPTNSENQIPLVGAQPASPDTEDQSTNSASEQDQDATNTIAPPPANGHSAPADLPSSFKVGMIPQAIHRGFLKEDSDVFALKIPQGTLPDAKTYQVSRASASLGKNALIEIWSCAEGYCLVGVNDPSGVRGFYLIAATKIVTAEAGLPGDITGIYPAPSRDSLSAKPTAAMPDDTVGLH